MNIPPEVRDIIYGYSAILTDKASLLCKSERRKILEKNAKKLPSFDDLMSILTGILACYEADFDFSSADNIIRITSGRIGLIKIPSGKPITQVERGKNQLLPISIREGVKDEEEITRERAKDLWETGKYRYVFDKEYHWSWYIGTRFIDKNSFLSYICPEWSLIKDEKWSIENAKLLLRAMRYSYPIDESRLVSRELVLGLFETPPFMCDADISVWKRITQTPAKPFIDTSEDKLRL